MDSYDWTGVVSEKVRLEMESNQAKLREAFAQMEQLREQSYDPDVYQSWISLQQNVRAIPEAYRPHVKTPAVTATSVPDLDGDELSQGGILTMEIHREVPIATASAHLNPPMKSAPNVYATPDFDNFPAGCPKVKVSTGTGTNHDFNVHLRPSYGGLLPTGKYRFKYTATISNVDIQSDFNESPPSPEDGI
jgi:hypothetical protein